MVDGCVKFCKKALVILGVAGAEPPCSAAPTAPGRRQAAKARRASFLVLLETVHVEVAGGFKPVLVHLDGQRPDQPQAALGVGEDAHDMGPAL
jgi:hypothetical protein